MSQDSLSKMYLKRSSALTTLYITLQRNLRVGRTRLGSRRNENTHGELGQTKFYHGMSIFSEDKSWRI